MKKTLIFVMTAILVLVSAFALADGKTLADIQAKGELVIATSPDFPPFEALQGDGSVKGIEIDIMEKVCDALGVKLVIEQVDFDSILQGISSGTYDVGVSGISVTEERKKNVLFTDPYCLAAQAIVVVEGSDIASKADLAGKLISVQTGTTSELSCLAEGYNVESYTQNVDAELAVLNNNVDAWVIDDLTAAEMVAANNAQSDKKLVILDEALSTEPYAFAFQFGSEDLVEAVNQTLNGLVEDGTVAAIFEAFDAPYTSPLAK
ncbi:MAG: transporter substrate-binding domain-containing protein [Clostridia bacterium]|nr:transporter substrate-binding domain-containing protein [Clostridia bacterium]